MSAATHRLSLSGGLLLLRQTRHCPRGGHCSTARCHAARRCGTHVVAAAAEQSGAPPGGVILRSLAANGECAVLVAAATPLVAHAQRLHQTTPTATAALGRGLIGGLLLAAFKKDGETVQLSFKGGGPLGHSASPPAPARLLPPARLPCLADLILLSPVIVCADAQGMVKGMVTNKFVEPPLRPDGKLNVGAAVGSDGTLSVVRNHPDWKEPYTGVVPITSGEVAEDIAHYLTQSEQVASAIGLGVLVGKDLAVQAAGGFLVQVLPFAGDDTLSALERNISALPSMTAMLSSGLTPAQITARILDGIGVSDGAAEMVPRYGPCVEEDIRSRMEKACVSLGESELQRIIEKEEKLEVRCELCCITLQLDAQKVLARAGEAPSKPAR